MATETNKFTDRAARSLRAAGFHSDGQGLYLRVKSSGAKSWVFRYRFGGRRRDMGLGTFEEVTLAEARIARDKAQSLLSRGLDPLGRAETMRASPPAKIPILSAKRVTLEDCWMDYVGGQEAGWRGRKTKDGWVRSIRKHAAAIKHLPVADIRVEDVLKVLKPLWMTKSESAGKLRERLERVLDFARVKRLRTGENPAVWKGNLVHLLPPRPKLQRGHMPAMPYEELPEFMVRLARSEGMSARALEFTILTVARETMTLEATWAEMEDDLWTLPALRMKEKAFRQPLSSGAQGVLEAVRPISPARNQLVFPSKTRGFMSNMAMDMILRDLAPGFTPHGMRSTFRDWAGDETEFAREVIEECLAHTVGDDTERAYRRGDALRKRREVLQAWSDYCLAELAARDRGDTALRPEPDAFGHGNPGGVSPGLALPLAPPLFNPDNSVKAAVA